MIVAAGLAAERAEAACPELVVLRARARVSERLAAGAPVERRALVEVEVRSTATTAVEALELGIFFGAGPTTVAETRVESLPSRRVRRLEGGGVAFRTVVDQPIPALATRRLEIPERRLPLDEDLSLVRARVADCRRVRRRTTPDDGSGPPLLLPWLTAALIAVALGIAGYRRWRGSRS